MASPLDVVVPTVSLSILALCLDVGNTFALHLSTSWAGV
ncbi:hypothetical protein LINPERHAP1_LOCUS15026 [Linum perenne]